MDSFDKKMLIAMAVLAILVIASVWNTERLLIKEWPAISDFLKANGVKGIK